MVCANTAVRRHAEERIIVTMVVTLPAGPAFVRLIAGVFSWWLGTDVDLDEAIEKLAR